MGKWKKLEISDKQELKDKFVNCQSLIRTGSFKCSDIQIMQTLLVPVLSGKKMGGESWIYESEKGEDDLTMIFTVKYIHSHNKWMIIMTMSNPFTSDNFVTSCEIMAEKVFDFMIDKNAKEIWGSGLLLYKYEDSVYAAAGYSKEDFLSIVATVYKEKGITHTYNKTERRFEMKIAT